MSKQEIIDYFERVEKGHFFVDFGDHFRKFPKSCLINFLEHRGWFVETPLYIDDCDLLCVSLEDLLNDRISD